jgi:hypothetical protein
MFDFQRIVKGPGCGSVIELFLSMRQSLGSISSTHCKNKLSKKKKCGKFLQSRQLMSQSDSKREAYKEPQ